MNKKLVSINIGAFQKLYGDEKALEIAKKIGADAVDFSLPRKKVGNIHPFFLLSEEERIEHYKAVKRKADELGIIIGQTHGVISGFKNKAEDDAYLLENAYADCLATSILGAKYCVMHGVTTIHLGKDADPQFMRDLNFEMFCKILPFAKKFGIKIATETFGDATVEYGGEKVNCIDFFGNLDEFIATFEKIAAVDDFKEYFCVCVDTGHSHKATRFGQPSAADVIRRLGDKVEVLHLNDNNTLLDQHRMPRTGTIDWADIMNALNEIGYDYTYNMEINLRQFGEGMLEETAAFAIKSMRSLIDEFMQ